MNSYLRLRDSLHGQGPQTGRDDFYLGTMRREEARDTLRPTAQQVTEDVLPALKKALDSAGQRDITTSCMVAMAKIGVDHPEFLLIDVFRQRLADSDQEIRETAALSLGIAGLEDAAPLLEGLVLDDAVGRAARGGRVDMRTRAFAAYGLGLGARRSGNEARKQHAFGVLRRAIDGDGLGDRNLKIGAITAIGLLQPDVRSYAGARLCDEALTALEEYYRRDLGPGDSVVQAHCATAIAKLVGREHARSGYYKNLFAEQLGERRNSRRVSNWVAQACALALGQMGQPHEDGDSLDAELSQQLLEISRSHVDEATRNFSLIALAQIGGSANRTALLREFDAASKAMRRPWCSLALGVYAFAERERQMAATGDCVRDDLITSTLFDELHKVKDPGATGALAIGLGLCGGIDASETMRALMLDKMPKERMAGDLCIGLALMDDAGSVESIRIAAMNAGRRPELLVRAAVALGRLGDRRVAEDLVALMTEGEGSLPRLAALSSALTLIGDRRTIEPLVAMLLDESVSALPRAFAAAAIGGIADPAPLPWNTPIGANMNYRASVETLTDQVAGVLDIL
jgi:HEAT repeat protein